MTILRFAAISPVANAPKVGKIALLERKKASN
jgi:hypothetical protein